MKYNKSITVFIPAYNEEGNIESASREILSFLNNNFKTYELLIVVNKCLDKTLLMAKKLAKQNKHIRIIEQKSFVGYGAQLKTGWENAKYDLVFYTDSDRQFDISELKNFMKYIPEYDIIIGFRKKRKDPVMRRFYSKLYNFAVNFLLGIHFKDIDCAFKLCKKEVIDKLRPFTQDRSPDAEFLTKAKLNNFMIKQIPVVHKPRIAGVSEAEEGKKRGFFIKIKPEIIKALIIETFALRRIKNAKK